VIIFGFRSFVKSLAMLTMVCHRCGNPAAHRLIQRSRWFTLFFIPLIPLGFTRFTTCTFCGVSQKVSKQDAEQMIAASQQTAPPMAQGGFPPAQQALPQQALPQQALPQQFTPPPAPGQQQQQPPQTWGQQ
jgi:hypothetical protein